MDKREHIGLNIASKIRDKINEILARYGIPSNVYQQDVRIDAACVISADFAIAALEPVGEPRVKPLVWAESIAQISYFANSCVGEYRVTKTRNARNDKWQVNYLDSNRRSHTVGYINGIETAKAAAQADYEARILAALE